MFEKSRELAKKFKTEIAVYRKVYSDPRTPRMSKVLLWLAIGYLLMPFDIIPDFIPVLGQIDDVIIVPLLVYLALKMIPPEIIAENRKSAAH